MSNTNLFGNWHETEIAQQILSKKYFHDGETFDNFVNRVSSIFSQELQEPMKQALINADFLPAGRSLYSAGAKGKFKASMSNCFTAGHKVITNRGLINIEDVKTGDRVITDNGTWQTVNEVMEREYFGDLYEITAETAYDNIVCTPNHRFLTEDGWVRADSLLNGNKRVRSCHKLKVPTVEFKKEYQIVDLFSEVKSNEQMIISCAPGDKLIYKVVVKNRGTCDYQSIQGNPINRYIKLDNDFMYFIGRWIGDGSIIKRQGKRNHSILQIVFNASTEREAFERCKSIGESVFGITASVCETKQNIIALRFENPIISNWFFKEFREKCDGKHIPDKYIGDMNIALGLLDSAGMIHTHGSVSITLKNINIINWLRDTLYLNGINCKQPRPTKHKDTYRLLIPPGLAKGRLNKKLSKTYHDLRHNKVYLEGLECNYVKVSDIKVIKNVKTKVYNLSVENVHSYSVNGIICHNCYIQRMPEDNIEDIFDVAKETARIFSYGGGVGINISNLRPRGAKVNNAARTSTGAVSFLEIFNSVGEVIGAKGRRAALMLGLNCNHPDIEEFLTIKQNTDKINSANLSILFTDEFMDAVKNNKEFELKFTTTGEEIKKTINARDFFWKFCEAQWNYAEPGALFIDRIRNYNLLSGYPEEEYKIDICNP